MGGGELIPLHTPGAGPHRLPKEGVVSIGRRAENYIVCNKDLSVSGKHCYLQCATAEVTDCSSNGTFVNDERLVKGQKRQLGDGDILSLSKPQEGEGNASVVRVQFRFLARAESSTSNTPPREPLATLGATPGATEGSRVHAGEGLAVTPGFAAGKTLSHGQFLEAVSQATAPEPTQGVRRLAKSATFEQDILLQEQQSKAKITGELLCVRRRLTEERCRVEAQTKELRDAKALLEDERQRRAAGDAARERLSAEASELRADRQKLQSLRTHHDDLQNKHDATEVELTTQAQRATALEAAQARAQSDLDHARGNLEQVQRRVEEVQCRVRMSQADVEHREELHRAAREQGERVREEVGGLQHEHSGERARREELEDRSLLLKTEIEQTRQRETTTKDLLQKTSAACEELQARSAALQSDAAAARERAGAVRANLEAEAEQRDRFLGLAAQFANSVRTFAENWPRELPEGVRDVFPLQDLEPSRAAAAMQCRSPAPRTLGEDTATIVSCGGGDDDPATEEEPVLDTALGALEPPPTSPREVSPREDTVRPEEEAKPSTMARSWGVAVLGNTHGEVTGTSMVEEEDDLSESSAGTPENRAKRLRVL